MKVLLAVPTKNRYREHQIQKNTLSWIVHTKYDWRLFVEPQDYDNYRKLTKNIVRIDQNDKGLGYSKVCIKQYAEKNGYDVVFKIDDDIINFQYTGFGRTVKNLTKEKRVRDKVDPLIENSVKAFKIFKDLGGISIVYGGGKYKSEVVEEWMAVNKRLQTCYLIRTELLCPPSCGILPCFEDFSTYLNLRKKGYFTLQYGLTGMIYEEVGANDGGIQDFNREKLAIKAKAILQALYPGLKWRPRPEKAWKFEPDLRRTNLNKL